MTARGAAVGELLRAALAALERLEHEEREKICARLGAYLNATEPDSRRGLRSSEAKAAIGRVLGVGGGR